MGGDDAAILPSPPQHAVVVTTDLMVDGVHFASGFTTNPQTMTAGDVGWRSAAANLSDLAAMGATPLGITVGLGLPGSLEVKWIEQLYGGIAACLEDFNTLILGGDVCGSPVITIAITALGQVLPEQVIRRSAARPGDVILISGTHGAARAGLELLTQPDWGADLSESDRRSLRAAHQRPRPRLDIPRLLRSLHPQARVAGMDSSDGLADAVIQICRASGVGARLQRSQMPMPTALLKTGSCSPEQALAWSLYGGEDFELVLALPPEIASVLLDQLGGEAAIIGEVVAGFQVELLDSPAQIQGEVLSLAAGFQHFA